MNNTKGLQLIFEEMESKHSQEKQKLAEKFYRELNNE
jgi:hypothetical protein